MPFTDSAGNVLTTNFVKAGHPGASFLLPVAATTGGIAASVIDLGAIYGTPTMVLVGGSGTGTIGLDGSLDGQNWIASDIAQTAASASNQRVTATVGGKPVRFLRVNVSVQVAVAAITVEYGAF